MKKLNWGHGIFIAIAIMILALMTLVFKTVNQKIELVNEDYYPKGLVYEEEIQKQKKTSQLSGKIEVIISDSVSIRFPTDFEEPNLIKGVVWFYRASEMKNDVKDSLFISESLLISYPIQQFKQGKYDVILDWKYKGESYYHKETIFIDKEE